MISLRHFFMLIALAIMFQSAVRAETLTYADLTKRLTNLDQLAVLPPVGEKTALASSYDRSSQYDAAQDKYIHWDANDDGRGIIRKEGDEEVLAEITGPGCIWRTWSARAQKGHVKIYLDGATTPTIDLPFLSYFNQKGFRAEPFTRPNLVYITTAEGYNNYTPIPFQKSCKIVGEKDWGLYFHFNYTQFPEGTIVPTFSMHLPPEALKAIDHANDILGRCGQNPAEKQAGQKVETKNMSIPSGKTASLFEADGEGAINAIKIKVSGLPKDIEKQRMLLGQLSIQMTWDGEPKPAVWSLLGDFFGSAAGAVPFKTLPTGLLEDGTFYCYWYMPFAKGAKIEIGNDSPGAQIITCEVTHVPLTQPIAQLGRFHAKWHRDEFLPTRKDRWPDWTLLTTQGRGRFVGTQLHIWSPMGGWWGEGDEKWFVDGEKFPSSFGTGTEDYFGYAWGDPKRFVQAFHSQPINENNHGHVDLNRWHIPDNVPFQTSFEGDLEKYFFNERPALYAAVAYWYLSADGTDPYTMPAPVADHVGWWVRPPIPHVPGAIEGEEMKVIESSRRETPIGDMGGWKLNTWSNDHDQQWEANQVGQRLRLQFKAPKTGKFHLLAHFTHSPEYGIFQMSLDETKLGHPIDLYQPTWGVLDPMDLGVVEIKAGRHIFGADVTGKNDASHTYAFGLDYIKLEPVE
jgi:hypothetical protein